MNEHTQDAERRGVSTETTDSDSDSNRDREGRASPLSRRGFLQASAATGVSALALGASGVAAGQSAEECDLWDQIEVGDGDFILFNNKWGMEDSEQCIWKNDDGTYGYDFTAVGDGINYPEVFIGTRPWGEDSGVAEFPIQRGDVDELVMEFDVDVNISGGEWNLAEEWWLMDGQPNAEDAPDTHEIMMVLDWENHSHGGVIQENVWTDQFGNTIDYWATPGGGTEADFHVFRVSGGTTTGQVDLKPVIDFMTDQHGVSEDLLLAGIELGNEYWAGTQGDVTYNQFDVTINGSTYTSGPGGNGENGTTLPDAPTALSSPDAGETQVDLEWSASSGNVDHYVVYVDGTEDQQVTSGTAATISGLSSGTSYEITVTAVGDDGTESSESGAISVTTESDADDPGDSPPSFDGYSPQDTTGDGLANDFTGSGSTTATDVNIFFENVDNPAITDNAAYYDFTGNGQVSTADVIELFERI